MNCDRCDQLLIDHAHDELDAELRAEVTRHLASCTACAVAYCRLRADLDGVLLLSSEAPPARLRRQLRAEVERAFRPTPWRRVRAIVARPVPAYAVAVAVGLCALLWLVRGPDGQDTSSRAAAGPARLSGYDAAAPLLPPRTIL